MAGCMSLDTSDRCSPALPHSCWIKYTEVGPERSGMKLVNLFPVKAVWTICAPSSLPQSTDSTALQLEALPANKGWSLILLTICQDQAPCLPLMKHCVLMRKPPYLSTQPSSWLWWWLNGFSNHWDIPDLINYYIGIAKCTLPPCLQKDSIQRSSPTLTFKLRWELDLINLPLPWLLEVTRWSLWNTGPAQSQMSGLNQTTLLFPEQAAVSAGKRPVPVQEC